MDSTSPAELLTPEARAALEKARDTPLSYGVRMYACPGPTRRLLVVLGEAHLKLAPAQRLGKEIVSCFSLRGVEGFQRRDVFAGRALGVLITAPRLLLRALTFGLVKGSTIADAKELPTGLTVELEKTSHVPFALHLASVHLTVLFSVLFGNLGLTALLVLFPDLGLGPLCGFLAMLGLALELHMLLLVPAFMLRRHWWSPIIHPAIGLVSARDMLMAKGTVRMLDADPRAETAIVVMGRAHLPGFERELVEKHGFERVDF